MQELLVGGAFLEGVTKPIQISCQLFIPHQKIFQKFHNPTCKSFLCVDTLFTIFNPILATAYGGGGGGGHFDADHEIIGHNSKMALSSTSKLGDF